jgi:hypothetical protein
VSRQRRCKTSIITAARLVEEKRAREAVRLYPVMLTLTFADVATWSPRCITAFMWCVRAYLARLGHELVGVWKLELGERGGRIHYHALLWLPAGVTLPKPDKRGWWSHGMTRIERARNSVGYIAKYAGKSGDLDNVPKGARLFAVVGLDRADRAERSWWQCPRRVREAFPLEDARLYGAPARARGGGWISRATGELLVSRWRYAGCLNVAGLTLIKLVEVADG